MGDNTAGARASLSRGAHAGLTVTAGFDPDPSVVQRAPPPAAHHSRARLPPPSAWMHGWMDAWDDVSM